MPHHPSASHIIDLYDRHASHWDHLRSNHFTDRRWIERFCSSLPPSSSVLDLGCGAGQPVAGFLIEAGHAVTGVDSSARMIARCRERFASHTWIHADMRTLELDRRFAGILAWNSFFHLHPDDQRGMFKQFQRQAAPGALLMFTSGTGLGEALGELQGETLYHASLDPQEYVTLLQDHGFEVLDHVVEDPQSGGLTVWLCRALPSR